MQLKASLTFLQTMKTHKHEVKNIYRPRKKYSKATKSAMRVRGGFVGSSGGRLGATIKNAREINKVVGHMMETAARSSKDPFGVAAETLAKLNGDRIKVKLGKKLFEKLGDTELLGKRNVVAESETTHKGYQDPATMLGKTYHTEFHVGRKPTKTVNLQAKLGGEVKEKYSDTLADIQNSTRAELSVKCGFNRKKVFWYGTTPGFWSYSDLAVLSEVNFYTPNPNAAQRCYWLTKWFQQSFKLSNVNKYLAVNVAVHFLSPQTDSDSNVAMRGTFSGVDGVQRLGSIPINQQYSDLQLGVVLSQVEMDPRKSFTSSFDFQESFKVQKTFRKKLQPGEIWKIDYRHFTGPGLNMNEIVNSKDSISSLSPLNSCFYFPVFEITGQSVEAYDSEDTQIIYTGTSIGMVHLEAEKTFCTATSAESKNDLYDEGAYIASNYAMKVYTDTGTIPNNSINQPFNLPYSDIQDRGVAPTAGKYVIPLQRETTPGSAGQLT